MRMTQNFISLGLIAGVAFSAMAQTPSEQKIDERREAVLAKAQTEIAALQTKRVGLATTYEKKLKELEAEREKLNATHGVQQVAIADKLTKLDAQFKTQQAGFRTRVKAIQADHVEKVAKLDGELKALQEKAKEEYTEEIRKEVKAYDEKRAAQEVARASALASLEDERVAALNKYFEALAAHELDAQAETKKMNEAKKAQFDDHAAKTAVLAAAYNQDLATLVSDRAKITQKASDDIYALLAVPNRTNPPVAAALPSGSAKGLVVEGHALQTSFTHDGKALAADSAEAVSLSAALSEVSKGKYDKDFSFAEKGDILYKGKVLVIDYHYSVSGIKMELSAPAKAKIEQGVLASLIQNLYRVPSESFADVMYMPVDENGAQLSLRNNPKLTNVLRSLLTDRKGDLLGVALVDDKTVSIDGKKVRLAWYFKDTDGTDKPLASKSKEALAEVEARFARQLKRTLTPVTVPQEVRTRLAAGSSAEPNAVVLAKAIKAPERCKAFVFIQLTPKQVMVARRKDSKVLFTATGVDSFDGLACSDDSVAFVGTAIQRTAEVKFTVNKNPGNDLKSADLVESEFSLESKDKVPALFVVHKDTVKLAVLAPEGTFSVVRAFPAEKGGGSFRTWATDKTGLLTEFTIAAAFDGSSAAPDVGGSPKTVAELSLQENK